MQGQPVAYRAVERCKKIAALGRVPSWWRFFARRRWIRSFGAIMAFDISEAAEMLRGIYNQDAINRMAQAPSLAFVKRTDRGTRWVEPVAYDSKDID